LKLFSELLIPNIVFTITTKSSVETVSVNDDEEGIIDGVEEGDPLARDQLLERRRLLEAPSIIHG